MKKRVDKLFSKRRSKKKSTDDLPTDMETDVSASAKTSVSIYPDTTPSPPDMINPVSDTGSKTAEEPFTEPPKRLRAKRTTKEKTAMPAVEHENPFGHLPDDRGSDGQIIPLPPRTITFRADQGFKKIVEAIKNLINRDPEPKLLGEFIRFFPKDHDELTKVSEFLKANKCVWHFQNANSKKDYA